VYLYDKDSINIDIIFHIHLLWCPFNQMHQNDKIKLNTHKRNWFLIEKQEKGDIITGQNSNKPLTTLHSFTGIDFCTGRSRMDLFWHKPGINVDTKGLPPNSKLDCGSTPDSTVFRYRTGGGTSSFWVGGWVSWMWLSLATCSNRPAL